MKDWRKVQKSAELPSDTMPLPSQPRLLLQVPLRAPTLGAAILHGTYLPWCYPASDQQCHVAQLRYFSLIHLMSISCGVSDWVR